MSKLTLVFTPRRLLLVTGATVAFTSIGKNTTRETVSPQAANAHGSCDEGGRVCSVNGVEEGGYAA